MRVPSRLGLYLHTARQLRWEQWVFRPIRRLQAALPPPRGIRAPLDEERNARMAEEAGGWGSAFPCDARARADRVVGGTFRFLNHEEYLPEIDWRDRYVSHLWSYNLHYFDYALDLAWAFRESGDERYTRRFRTLAGGWMDQVGSGGGDGWEPYALSLRIVNWLYALWLFGDGLDPAFRARLAQSVARQAAHLESRTERHILANHLQKNLKALVVAGLAFSGPDAARWLRRAEVRLWEELAEQVLPDGGHFERSPMYHAIALGDFLEVLALYGAAERSAPPGAVERLRRMIRAFRVLARDDGALHLFNDAAHGIAPSSAWLRRMSERVLPGADEEFAGAVALPESGYYAYLAPGDGERFVVDCGPPGPVYQPGHAHCDLLSFELDLAGRPVVVDSGTSGYGGDPFREYARSVRAHNTVSIDGREQSEIWGTFRVARRARVVEADHHREAGRYRFQGAYRPYHAPGVVHRRVVEGGAGEWVVTDVVEGAEEARLTSYLHLHPDLPVRAEGGVLRVEVAGTSVRIEPFGVDHWTLREGEVQPVQGWYCPEFGRALPAPVLEMQVARNRSRPFGYRIEQRSR